MNKKCDVCGGTGSVRDPRFGAGGGIPADLEPCPACGVNPKFPALTRLKEEYDKLQQSDDWTTTRPTQPGFYWWRGKGDTDAKIVEVVWDSFGIDDDLKLIAHDTRPAFLDGREFRVNWTVNEGEWKGPLKP